MFDFEKISLKKIIVFNEILIDANFLKESYVKQKYTRNAINYEETVLVFKKLNLVKSKNNEILISKKYKSFLKKYKDSKFKVKILTKFFIDSFLFNRNFFSKYIDEFLGNFNFKDNYFRFKVKTDQKIKYSGIRNFLKELGFIIINTDGNEYIISKKYSVIYKKHKEDNKLKLSDLKKMLEEKEKLGYDAELRIIQYEKERLSIFPLLIDKIEHISLSDVSAGYDIRSFEDKLDKNNDPIVINIEVKAVPFWEYEFKWTKNEINSAKFYKDKYCLYLLPVKVYKDFDIKNLKIIRDPYKNVYKNKKAWLSTEEVLSFSFIR